MALQDSRLEDLLLKQYLIITKKDINNNRHINWYDYKVFETSIYQYILSLSPLNNLTKIQTILFNISCNVVLNSIIYTDLFYSEKILNRVNEIDSIYFKPIITNKDIREVLMYYQQFSNIINTIIDPNLINIYPDNDTIIDLE